MSEYMTFVGFLSNIVLVVMHCKNNCHVTWELWQLQNFWLTRVL